MHIGLPKKRGYNMLPLHPLLFKSTQIKRFAKVS